MATITRQKARANKRVALVKFDRIARLDKLINSRQEGASLYQDELAREARQIKKQLNNTWRKRVNKIPGNLWNKKNAKAFK